LGLRVFDSYCYVVEVHIFLNIFNAESEAVASDTPRKIQSPRQQVFMELVQTESNYVGILRTIMSVSISTNLPFVVSLLKLYIISHRMCLLDVTTATVFHRLRYTCAPTHAHAQTQAL
jgi:hypothetical protein